MKVGAAEIGLHRLPDVVAVEPRSPGHVQQVEIGLLDVRAAEPIRARFDFIRDGWSTTPSPSRGCNWSSPRRTSKCSSGSRSRTFALAAPRHLGGSGPV